MPHAGPTVKKEGRLKGAVACKLAHGVTTTAPATDGRFDEVAEHHRLEEFGRCSIAYLI